MLGVLQTPDVTWPSSCSSHSKHVRQHMWRYTAGTPRQESLANAKVSARQQCVYEARRNLLQINARNIILKCRFSGLQRCLWQYEFTVRSLAVIASQICETPRNSERIRPCSSSRSSKVVDLSVSRKRIYDLLLVISIFNRISFRFRDTYTDLARIYLVFTVLPLFDAPSGGMPCDINIINRPLRSTFNGLQIRRWQYGSTFIRLAVVGSQISDEILRNSDRIRPCSSSRSSKVIDIEWCQSKAHMRLPISQ